MVDLITNVGEEYHYENNANGDTMIYTVYNDTTDSLGEGSNLTNITTEPSGASFARQSDTVTTRDASGSFGYDNDNQISFDTSDSSQTVDAGAQINNFQSDTVAGDGAASDNLVAAGDLSQSRDLSSIDTLNISAGDFNVQDM